MIGDKKSRSFRNVINGKTSNWFTVMPISRYHFNLSPIELRDDLALRYHRPLLRMPAFCDDTVVELNLVWNMCWTLRKEVL